MRSTKVFHILSYIPFLFLISSFIPQKNKPTVAFHRRQGALLTIFAALIKLIATQFAARIRLAYALSTIASAGTVLAWLVWGAAFAAITALMVIGIVRAARNIEKPLPVIGNILL